MGQSLRLPLDSIFRGVFPYKVNPNRRARPHCLGIIPVAHFARMFTCEYRVNIDVVIISPVSWYCQNKML